MWETITNIILILSIITLAAFGCLGLHQWITRKSFKKIDKQLRWILLPIALVVVVYLICDLLLPKLFPGFMPTRPNGSGEPSFPSTHVLVVATVFFCTTVFLPKYVKDRRMRIVLEIIMIILISLTCIGRVYAYMHTPIDVVGALIFAFIFSEIYYRIIKKKKSKK